MSQQPPQPRVSQNKNVMKIDELKDGIVKVRGTANECEVWKVKEYTKKKKMFLVKDQNGSSNTSTTTEAQQENQLKNLPIDISNKGGKDDNKSKKDGDNGAQPKANHHDQQQQQQRDANSRRKGSRGFTSGSIYEIGESSQMGERKGEPSQTPQTSRYPMGHIEAQNDRMDNMGQYRMNQYPINRGNRSGSAS